MSSIQPETARMWADRLTQHLADLKYQLMLPAADNPDLAPALLGFYALAQDMRTAVDR